MIIVDSGNIEIKTFPNGECRIETGHFNKPSSCSGTFHHIELKFENDAELFHLMLIKKHFDEMGHKTRLTMPYLPYSRMDRTHGEFVFTLKYFADFINKLDFSSVKIWEVHSDVGSALFDRRINVPVSMEIAKRAIAIEGTKFLRTADPTNQARDFFPAVFLPDYGALKRYSGIEYPTMWGLKTREFKTGKITGMKIMDSAVAFGCSHVFIVDDLCSYGGTFIAAAEALRQAGFLRIYLCVTHCEKSILQGQIVKNESQLINKVYTTNSIISQKDIDEAGASNLIQLVDWNN